MTGLLCDLRIFQVQCGQVSAQVWIGYLIILWGHFQGGRLRLNIQLMLGKCSLVQTNCLDPFLNPGILYGSFIILKVTTAGRLVANPA